MVNQGDRVIVEYRGKLDDGTEFASTKVQGEPLEFVAGSGVVLPDFDYAVMGMDVGETRSIHIPADRAYGQRDEELVISMPVTSLPNGEALPVGAMLGIQTPEGDVMRVRVLEVGDEEDARLQPRARRPESQLRHHPGRRRERDAHRA